MSPVAAPDFPCLYPLGFHPLSLEEVEVACVAAFPLSRSRRPIMDGLQDFHRLLATSGVVGKLWLDGSFTTEKIDPKDVDVVLMCKAEIYDAGPPEVRTAIELVISNLKSTNYCDSYICFEYPEGHPLYDEWVWNRAYWLRQYGFSREIDPKGIVVVSIDGVAT